MKFPIKTIKRNNQIVALPKNTSEVSKLVKFAKKIKYHILPIGGETNRVDGTKPQFEKTILIDFKKMNRIEEVDTNNFIITAQGGTLLKTIQKSANSKKLLFPVNIAPNDKCTIGGNISTNVGGLQTLRYGNIEDHVNGLEVVLSDGTILNFLNKLKKDNFGPKLWKLFCGSEGVFGIITRASLKLIPKKDYKSTYLIQINSLNKSIRLLKYLRNRYFDNLTSFEIIFPIPSSLLFNENKNNYNLIIEIQSNDNKNYKNELKKYFSSMNLVINKREDNKAKSWIWKKREILVYNQIKYNFTEKFDISLPLDKWSIFINKINTFTKNNKEFTPYFFGHLGDGNLHCNFKVNPLTKKNCSNLSKFIYELTIKNQGSVAAEHGLGLKKNNLLKKYKPNKNYIFLKKLKKHLDPDFKLGKNKLFKA